MRLSMQLVSIIASMCQSKGTNLSISEDANVYVDDGGVIFDASLNQNNIGDNNNKFYFLQLLKAKDGKKHYTHTRWLVSPF